MPKKTPSKRPINRRFIHLYLTFDCNLSCTNCASSCQQAPNKDFISLAQIDKFIEQSLDNNEPWERIKLYGGEPTLHPDFLAVVDRLAEYRQHNTDCQLEVISNGYGDEVKKKLAKLPGWMRRTVSTDKGMAKKLAVFISYNVAPIDTVDFKKADFTTGCRVPKVCGICLSPHGYFPCSVGADVARIFGLDIGLRNLKDLTEDSMRRQMAQLCRVCGFFKMPYQNVASQEVSPAWQRAYKQYRSKPPKMSRY